LRAQIGEEPLDYSPTQNSFCNCPTDNERHTILHWSGGRQSMWSAPRPGIGPERSAPARPPHRRHHGWQDLHPGISWRRCGRLQSTGVPFL